MPIDYEIRDDGIAVVTFNRPEKLNAVTGTDIERLFEVYEDIRVNPKVKAAMITGAGQRGFTTGMDLSARDSPEMKRATARYKDPHGVMLHMAPYTRGIDIWKPLVAAVNGHAIAMGACIILGCDIRIASTNASISFNEVLFGGLASGGALARLPRQVPYAYAMDLLLTGRRSDAQEMLRFGLVTEVHPPERLLPRALEIARQLVGLDSAAVQITKQATVRGMDVGLAQAMVEEALYMEMLQARHGGSDELMQKYSARFKK